MIRGRRRWSPTPPPRRPSVKSEKQRQDATQRGTAQQHRPIERCQPKQPAFAHYTTDHRYARCETGSNITLARNEGCSAEVTSPRKRRRGSSNTKGLDEGLGTLPGSVAFLPHAEAEQRTKMHSHTDLCQPCGAIRSVLSVWVTSAGRAADRACPKTASCDVTRANPGSSK
jgi:hypothetical protein